VHYNPHTVTQSLYIHWPFCPYKCHFCPFVALASHDQFMERYHKALVLEIEQFARERVHNTPLKTIHFGGGTPSTYPPALLLDIFGILKRSFIIEPTAEIALEINPGTVSDEKIAAWRDVGINRLSIGVQAINDRVLQSLNRHQTASQVFSLLDKVSPFFDNISIDLILGLPSISAMEWQEMLKMAMQWPIKHISIYFLTVHENTPLYFKVQANQVVLPADEEMVATYEYTCGFLAQHGFEQYELSNFAKIGYASRHNSAYWDREPYKGFGIGACSFDGAVRFQNEKNIMRYMEVCEQQESAVTFFEQLTATQIALERLMLGLRRPQGVGIEMIENRATIEQLMRDGYLEYHGTQVRLTRRGLAVENEILARLEGTA
jgi:oxygen-independent coproporphyrinogen-3 oxidase